MRLRENPTYASFWWNAAEGKCFESVFRTVDEIVRRQGSLYSRFIKLEALYDPNNLAVTNQYMRDGTLGQVTENLIASNVDTTYAAIASTDVGVRVQTDGADWSTQRRARHLEFYAEQLKAQYDIVPKCRLAFREAAKKGLGAVAVTSDSWDRLKVEHVLPDDVVVDELETRYGLAPRQLHIRRSNVSKESLKQEFPRCAKQIEVAGAGRGRDYLRRGGYFLTRAWECVEIESWSRPIGVKGSKGYKPGRHTRTIDGCDLVDEEWDEDYFPVATIVWTERAGAWFGISLAERIAGHQRVVNKRHWQIDRQLDQLANPTTWVRPADANLSVRTINELGTIGVVVGDYPKTETPSPVSAQTFQHLEMVAEKAFNESGVSRLAAQAQKPAGLDSGAALRVYHDRTTQRFAPQEEAFEQLVLGAVHLAIARCKMLGAKAPAMMRTTRFGPRKIEWSKVDMGEFKVQLAAASTLDKEPAGREQQLIEWAQAGVITTDDFRRMVGHPDLEREMSLYRAAMENVDGCLEDIADGKNVVPNTFMNLKMAIWRGQQQEQIWERAGAPETVLEGVRQFVVLAIYWDGQGAQAANANMAGAAGPPMPGAMPGPPGPGAMPPPGAMPSSAPGAGTPSAALSPQAMQLIAGAG